MVVTVTGSAAVRAAVLPESSPQLDARGGHRDHLGNQGSGSHGLSSCRGWFGHLDMGEDLTARSQPDLSVTDRARNRADNWPSRPRAPV